MQIENHDTMKISIQTVLVALLLAFTCSFGQAQDCVGLYFESSKVDDDLIVQLKVDNFENMLGAQFAITYTYANLELTDVQGNSEIQLTTSNVFSDVPGYISVSWSNPSMGQTLADGSVLLEMHFTEIITDVSDFAFDTNFSTEFFDAFFEEICFQATPHIINENRAQITGRLYHDLNNNCIADPSDFTLSGWTVLIDGGSEKYYRITDAFGYYSVPVEIGSYTLEVIEHNDLWDPCAGPVLVTVEAAGEILENSFVLSPKTTSSALDVVVSSSAIKRCANNTYSVKYENNGTAVAQSAELDFELDENLEYVSTNTSNFVINDKVITFDLGNIKPGEGGEFLIVLGAPCVNIEVGQTLCVEARISSSDVVIPPAEWNGAVLTTEATCEGDSVAFTIQNIGVNAMAAPLQSIVVEEDVMFGINEVDLGPSEMVKFKHAARGGVYRIIVDQEEGYPLGNYSTDFIEFCNGGDTETYQYVSMFQNEDESPYVDIQCQEVKDITDPNSMSAFPIGYREDHLINQNEDIEYTIHFQNLSADTVDNMYISNFIDESLNIETLTEGPSSHKYILSVTEDRRLKISFNNIQLPSASENEFASKGFIKYRISQNKDVPLGTKINIASMIFFDLVQEVGTNLVTHTVGEEFIEIVLGDEDLLLDNELTIAPNPAVSSIRIELPEQYTDLSYVIYDTKGSVVSAANSASNVFYIYRDFLKTGMYLLEIRSSSKILGTKKIVFQD